MAEEKEVEVRALKLISQDTMQLIDEWNRIMGLMQYHKLGGRTQEIESALQKIKRLIKQNEDVANLIKQYGSLKIKAYD